MVSKDYHVNKDVIKKQQITLSTLREYFTFLRNTKHRQFSRTSPELVNLNYVP